MANATTEYTDVGIVNHNTLTPLLSNQFGSFGMKNIENVSGWEMVSLDEGLVPFINETESGRAILAYTHRAQVMPIKDGDEPFVATGAEYITPQLASSRFLQKAKKKGKVVEVKKDVYVKVKYEDGMEEYIDTTPRNSSTSRASFILLDLETLEVGEKFDVGESIAWTKVFNKDNCYVSGKNLRIAVMNYLGFSHEDSYPITNNVAETQFQTDILEEVTCIVPLNTKILSIITKLGTQTNQDDELMSFSYMGDLDDYLDAYNIIDDTSSEEEMIAYTYEKNKMQILSPGGELVMIKVFINNKQQIDPSVAKLWKELVTDLKTKQKLYGKNKTTKEAKLEANDNLDLSMLKIGTHKYHSKLFDGARISFFIKREKPISEGDKMCNRFGAKGVVGHIIPKDKTPYAKSIGDIDIFIAPSGVLGRKNLIIIKELYIGKIFYLLPEILSKKASNSKTKTQSLIDIINTVYETLDGSKDNKYTKSISNKLSKMSPQKLRKMLMEKTLKLNFFVQPFENISFDKIKSVAKVLDIPLDEKVFIPETKTWTKVKVPVGVQYFNRMEQQATDYESLRSTGAYVGITGQPKKGRTDYSGQALGNLDIYNIVTYDAPDILKELLTVRSDNVRAKRRMQMEIIQNGKVNMPILTSTGKTQQLKNMYVTALGLQTSEQA